MPAARTPREAAISYPNDEVGADGSGTAQIPPSRRGTRRVRRTAGFAFLALVVVVIAGFEIYLRPAETHRAGGCRRRSRARPGRERLERAHELLDAQLADTLVVSMARGGQRAATDAVCADEPAEIEVICFTADPFNTRGEARAIAQLSAARGWTKLLVVTSDYHVRRARLLFARCYDGSLAVVGASSGGDPDVVLTDAHEAAGLVYANLVARGC